MNVEQTLEQIVARYGDWSETPIADALDFIQRKQARLLEDLGRYGAGIYPPLRDYLRAQAQADPTDPEVAKYFLVRKHWGWADFQSEPLGDRIPRPRGRPAKTDADKRRQWDVRLTPAVIEAVIAAAALDGQPPRTWAAQQLAQAAAQRLAATASRDRAARPAGAPRAPGEGD